MRGGHRGRTKRSQRHRMRWWALTPTQYQELIRQPHQRRTVRVYAGEQVEHRVRIADASREKVTFLLLESSLCRHDEIPSRGGRRGGEPAPLKPCLNVGATVVGPWCQEVALELSLAVS